MQPEACFVHEPSAHTKCAFRSLETPYYAKATAAQKCSYGVAPFNNSGIYAVLRQAEFTDKG